MNKSFASIHGAAIHGAFCCSQLFLNDLRLVSSGYLVPRWYCGCCNNFTNDSRNRSIPTRIIFRIEIFRTEIIQSSLGRFFPMMHLRHRQHARFRNLGSTCLYRVNIQAAIFQILIKTFERFQHISDCQISGLSRPSSAVNADPTLPILPEICNHLARKTSIFFDNSIF